MSKRIFSIYLWTLWWVSVPFQHLREVSSGGDCRGVSTYSEGNSGNKNKPIICWTLNRVNSKSNSIPKAFSPYWIHCAHWIRCISRQYLPWSIFELQPCRVCWNIPERSNHNIIDSAWPKSWQPLQKGFKKNTKKLDRKKNFGDYPKATSLTGVMSDIAIKWLSCLINSVLDILFENFQCLTQCLYSISTYYNRKAWKVEYPWIQDAPPSYKLHFSFWPIVVRLCSKQTGELRS